MRKFIALAVLSVAAFASIGCAGLGRHNNLEIVNQSSYDITVNANGQPLTFKFGDGRKSDRLRPSESGNISCYRAAHFVAKAWNEGEFVGVATFDKRGSMPSSGYGYGSGYYSHIGASHPDSWIIEDRDFEEGKFLGDVRNWLRRP